MASRTLFRRVLQINRRSPLQRTLIPRSLVPVNHTTDKCLTQCQSYSQVRKFCTKGKAGEGVIVNIQDAKDFEETVLNNPLPVVVDFHAT